MKSLLLMILFLCSYNSFAKGWYFGGHYGANAVNGGSLATNLLGDISGVSYRESSMTSVVVGHGWDGWHLEAIYSQFGDMGFTFESDVIDYERNIAYMGVNLRYVWKYFSIGFGYGRMNVDATITRNFTSPETLSDELEEGTNSYMGSYFSWGFQIPFTNSFTLMIESHGYGWDQKDGTISYFDGVSSTTESDLGETQAVGVLNVGFRYYWGG
jgi:hypothetical protein